MKRQAGDDYELIDSGDGRKLERFGPYTIVRPSAAAVWRPSLPEREWGRADAWFDRDGGNSWTSREKLPETWSIEVEGLRFVLSTTDFGHLGIFPEQRDAWRWIRRALGPVVAGCAEPPAVLNLFAYSGGATLAAAAAGAAVCHLDASRGMVARARDNARLNGFEQRPIRWIVEDVGKFLEREHRRGSRYRAVILDPPSFGRGKSGEVYKIEKHLQATLDSCVALLDDPLFLLLSCHTPAYTPQTLLNIMEQAMRGFRGKVVAGEMLLRGAAGVMPLPSGVFSLWTGAGCGSVELTGGA